MKFLWQTAPLQPLLTRSLVEGLGVSSLLAQCLVNRGFTDLEMARSFLTPRLKQLADPFVLPNMRAAVDRLSAARAAGECVVLFGDYDVDGVTSVALLIEVLRHFGWQVEGYLPNRMQEGYGLTQEGVENCLAKYPASVLLAVDCGSTAVETIGRLRERGVDVIVLDHHQVSNPAPAAAALVNPHLAATGNAGAGTELCSAGLAFKLAHALVKHGRQAGWPGAEEYDLRSLLDLVALATIADLVPLRDENRILVSAGLDRLRSTERPGLVALKEVAGVGDRLGVYEAGFQLAPRLNAAGRLETAEGALKLLQAGTVSLATPLAHELDSRNRERQQIEKTIVDTVLGSIRGRFNPQEDYVIVEGQLLWHIGVVGIVASRVLREFHRPTLIVGGEGDAWRGSGRSIEGFDLAAALRACDDLLIRHGGHAMAAGITVHPDKLDALRARLNEIARRTLTEEQLRPILRVDAIVPLGEMTLDRVKELERIEPLGQGNPPVQLAAVGLRHARPPECLGKQGQHLKLRVTAGGPPVEAVWWNCADRPRMTEPFDLAFAPQINEFNGRRMVQLKVLDWQPGRRG